jgi:carbon storage regulator
MLITNRKPGDRVQIGPHIEISIIAVEGQTVRLGVVAPGSVRVRMYDLAHGFATPRQSKP